MNKQEFLPTTEKNEIIVYQPEGGEFHIEVRVENETVWLTQAQMAELFATDRTSVNRHIRNIYQTQELDEKATCAKIAQVRMEGRRTIKRSQPYYNLDMIISVGYRVNSICGTRFRQWANQVLKEHLLRGCSINQRLISHENRLENHDSRIINLEKQVDFFVKANLPPSEGLFPAHAHWSGYEFAVQLVRSAKKELIIIDPFANDMVLSLMAKRAEGVNAIIYSARITRAMREEEARLNRQFPTVRLENMREVHDRFVIVDDVVYHVGASFKDLGNQMTAFSVLNFITKEQVLSMVK